jgi:hypothetical protein
MMADKRKDMTAVALQRVRELGWEELRKEEAMMMKTYTIEVDGKPAQAFRANDDADAERICRGLEERFRMMAANASLPPSGAWCVRLATIPEQAKWRAGSVECTVDGWDEPDGWEEGHENDFSHDQLLVSLNDEG